MNPHSPSPDDDQPTGPLPGQPGQQPTQPLPPPYVPAPPAPGTDFFGWIRGHGIYRGEDRWIGGVSSGIAHRLGVDPVIIRGVFIVLTLFAGIGVLLYGLAWAFLPEPDGRIHVQEAGAGRWSSGMTGSLVATVLGLTGLGGGFWGWSEHGFGGFLWTVFWVGGAIYLVYYLSQRNKGAAQPAMAGPNPDAPHGPAPYGPAPYAAGSPYTANTSGAAQASAFSVTGSIPGATPPSPGIPSYGSGYLPPQVPSRPQKPRPVGPGAPVVAIAAGAALLAGGSLKALDAGNVINLGSAPNAIVWAAAAAVFGVAILLSGLRGRSAGILSLFAVLTLVAGGMFNFVGNGERFRFQQVAWAPASIQEAQDGFDVTGGRGTLDFTELGVDAPLRSDVVIPLDITASDVTVIIPDNVPVDIEADMTLGNLNEASGRRGGTTTRESSYNTGEPGNHMVIQIDGTFSNITIQEGN